jgi:hypothetical protein
VRDGEGSLADSPIIRFLPESGFPQLVRVRLGQRRNGFDLDEVVRIRQRLDA